MDPHPIAMQVNLVEGRKEVIRRRMQGLVSDR